MTCRQSTNLVGTWMAVEAAYQRKALQNDPEGFAKMKAWHDDRVRTAAKVLADSWSSHRTEHKNQVNRRRRQLTVIVVVAALAAVVGLAAGRFVRSPASVAAETAPPPLTTLTAQVERRAITQTIIARGETLISGRIDLTPGAPPDGMQSVVTDVLARPRAQVHSGQVLLEVAERPMFILRGEIPMYRDIEPGDSGRDVVQLQAALRDLGWSIWDLAGEYGGSTQSAVLNQYRRMGYEPPRAEPTPIEPDDSTDTSSVNPRTDRRRRGPRSRR